MKRSALGHTKTRRLMRMLEVSIYEAVGILEVMWHLTAREAPQGNIGKLTDDDIADAIGWKHEPKKLIDGLVKSGWIDKNATYRLIVHDWHEHSDDAVKKSLLRAKLPFLSGNVATESDKNRLPEPSLAGALPEPKPEPTPEPGECAAAQIVVDPSMVAQKVRDEVRINLGYGPNSLNEAIQAIAKGALNANEDLGKLSDDLVASCLLYQKERKNLRVSWGWEKFIGHGYWKDPKAWPWRDNYDAESGDNGDEFAGLLARLGQADHQGSANDGGVQAGEGWFRNAVTLR